MKIQVLLFTLLMVIPSSNCWTQQKKVSTNEKKSELSKNKGTLAKNKQESPKRKIKYYHVEETVLLKFGGYKTVYDVYNPNVINTFDLGPNGTRTITPVYADDNNMQHEEPILKPDTIMNVKKTPLISVSDTPKKTDSYVYIDVIKTYERVSDKGYESIDMLKKIGNSYFFNDDYEKAEKCYSKLFSLTTDLEPEYYYRYSIALKATGNIKKSDEFLKKFNQLSNTTTKQ